MRMRPTLAPTTPLATVITVALPVIMPTPLRMHIAPVKPPATLQRQDIMPVTLKSVRIMTAATMTKDHTMGIDQSARLPCETFRSGWLAQRRRRSQNPIEQ